MSRILMAGFGGFLIGFAMWFLVGLTASLALSRSKGRGADRVGFFKIGPLGGLFGMALGSWFFWSLFGDPASAAVNAAGLGVSLLAIVATTPLAAIWPSRRPALMRRGSGETTA